MGFWSLIREQLTITLQPLNVTLFLIALNYGTLSFFAGISLSRFLAAGANGTKRQSCWVIARRLAHVSDMLSDLFVFVVGEVVADMLGFGRRVQSLDSKLGLENVADKVAERLFLVQAG